MQTEQLDGQVFAITGVTKGLGRALAVAVTSRGGAVMGMARDPGAGDALAAELETAPGDFSFVAGDVSVVADCAHFLRHARARYGGVDTLVNNAGKAGVAIPTHELTEADWDAYVDTNLKGAVFCTRFALPSMIARGGGSIINVGSTASVLPLAAMTPYNVAKGSLLPLTRTIAVEYVGRGVRCNALVLGGMDTDGNREARAAVRASLDLPPDDERPVAGLLDAGDVAVVILFLASPQGRLVNGSVINMDNAMAAGMNHSTYTRLAMAGQLPRAAAPAPAGTGD